MKTLLLSLLLLLPLKRPSATPDLLRSFMREAIEQKLSNSGLVEKYFNTRLLHRPDEPGAKARKFLDYVLTIQRDSLRAQRLAVDALDFTAYDALPASEIPPRPFHMLGETEHVYVARRRKKIILYFLLQDDKIASTLLLGKGDEHYFVDFSR